MPVIPVLRRLRQEDGEFKARLDYLERPCLKKKISSGTFFLSNMFQIKAKVL
jgi:hypothetical protein